MQLSSGVVGQIAPGLRKYLSWIAAFCDEPFLVILQDR
jgi:hypothetical protein